MASAQITFQLKDQYTMKIWNPELFGETKVRTISGQFFFSVIYSVHRERISRRTSTKIKEHADKILNKFALDISVFEDEILNQIRIFQSKKADLLFDFSFETTNTKPITFNPSDRGGVCPENAAFLRSFIKFDEYVALLNEVHHMSIISEKDYFKERKEAQEKLASIFEKYHTVVKRFHRERKKISTSRQLNNSKQETISEDTVTAS